MEQYRLRYKAHDLELAPGEFLIGRSEECQLALDDPMVSRKHAALRVSSSGVVAVDLGSRNGVTVNGEKIKTEKKLGDGDRIGVGGHELVLAIVRPENNRRRRLSTRTLGAIDVRDLQSTVTTSSTPPKGTAAQAGTPPGGLARVASALPTLALLADKALALGRVDEAERLLVNVLNDLMREVRKGHTVEPSLLERASGYALKLAGGQKAAWVDWVIEAYYLQDKMLPSSVADELAGVARKVRGIRMDLLGDYCEAMNALSPHFGPNERFVLQRIDGLRAQLSGR
ncbi:MAG TPA: FHA domain-containing protein [Polyangiaceae bacterium]|jgi:hypothetical protein|nr:FHA domain-containing protein [Polyangiaceae bacterium]